MLINRKVFDSLGVFDASMLHGGCDHDFICRAQARGFEVWSAPKAMVHHLIPPYRLTLDYFRWRSMRVGDTFAYIDCKRRGRTTTLLLCIARIGQALLINLPRLLLAYVLGDQAEVVGRKSLLWRAVGYTRQTLFLFAPRVFTQERFFDRLESRGERTSFGGS